LAGVVATAVHAIWNMPLTIQATIYPAAILLGLTCAGTYRCIQREPDGGAGSADGFDAEGKPGSRRGKSVNGFAVASLAGVLAAALAVAWRPAVLLTAQGYLNGARVLNENRQYAPGAYLARQTLRLTSAPWRTRFLLGGILYGQQYYSAALAEFSQDEIENPWGGDAILHRGKALRQMGKLDEAEAECRRALALIPNYADAAATIASLAWYRASEAGKAGRRGEAATQLRRARVWIAYALGFFPGNAEALRLLGFIELKEGRLERAGAAWERYVRAKPGDRAMKDRLVALRAEMDRRKSGGIGR
jgi:tetratricopeptide (TPR) repeat protein